MVHANTPEDRARQEHMPQPRLLRIGDEIHVFEGLTQPDQGENAGFYREDQLVLPYLSEIAFKVNWHNRYKIRTASKDMVDPLNAATQDFSHLKSDQTFTAQLEVTPEMFEMAWLLQEGSFMHAPRSASRHETPKVEHARLLILQLFTDVKLVVTTPIGAYKASAESNTATPLTYSKFRPYRWQFLGDQPMEPKRLYAPDSADLSVLTAQFVLNDPSSASQGTEPLDGNVPDRPLVGV